MAGPATLSQLGEHFRESPAHIRHHVKLLEQGDLVELAKDHALQNHLEKYYQASSTAFLIHLAILPETPKGQLAITIGSKDLATQSIAGYFSRYQTSISIQIIPLNSLDGLFTLNQGVCQMATCHLLDPDTGEYNRPYVRHLFPGQAMAIIPLFHREEGLILQPGNPQVIRDLWDLTRPGIRMINREPGSGIRIWLDQKMKEMGYRPESIDGYRTIATTHQEVAQTIRSGLADVGIGIEAIAIQYQLDFVPLFEEPYELVLPYEQLNDPRFSPLFEHLNSGKFRSSIREMAGYSVSASAGQATVIS